MRRFIVTKDAHRYEIPCLTFGEFSVLELWDTSNEMDYDEWLRVNGYTDPTSLNDETLSEAFLILETGVKSTVFKVNGEWVYYNQVQDKSIKEQARLNKDARDIRDKFGHDYRSPLVVMYKTEDFSGLL